MKNVHEALYSYIHTNKEVSLWLELGPFVNFHTNKRIGLIRNELLVQWVSLLDISKEQLRDIQKNTLDKQKTM